MTDYIEIESGGKSARPQLFIAQNLREDAVLLVAKLDRLARSVAFLATLMESRVRFQAIDLLAADEFTIYILAAVAQKEASAIFSRTWHALGDTLGTPVSLTDEAKLKGSVARQINAQTNVNNRQAPQLAVLLRATGVNLRTIASS